MKKDKKQLRLLAEQWYTDTPQGAKARMLLAEHPELFN